MGKLVQIQRCPATVMGCDAPKVRLPTCCHHHGSAKALTVGALRPTALVDWNGDHCLLPRCPRRSARACPLAWADCCAGWPPRDCWTTRRQRTERPSPPGPLAANLSRLGVLAA